jgi:hypothetical protein
MAAGVSCTQTKAPAASRHSALPVYVPCFQLHFLEALLAIAQLQIQAREIDTGPAQPRTQEASLCNVSLVSSTDQRKVS